jgi:hypothetical protein
MVIVGERIAAMSLAELIPAVRALPRSEKYQFARLLLDDLAGEELLAELEQGQECPIYTPEFAPEAVAQLARLLGEKTAGSP